jgi:hypothetical protein
VRLDCSNICSEFIGADKPDALVVPIMQVKTVKQCRIVNQGKLFLDDNLDDMTHCTSLTMQTLHMRLQARWPTCTFSETQHPASAGCHDGPVTSERHLRWLVCASAFEE